jgi:hypothetical protein
VILIHNKLSSALQLALVTALLFLLPGEKADAQSAARSFQMSLWECCDGSVPKIPEDTDIRSVAGQPATGRYLLVGLDYRDTLTPRNLDWSRVVAVEVDEPYGPQNDPRIDSIIKYPDGSPACQGDPSAYIAPIDASLKQMATKLKGLNPKARFWVNLTQAEANWIGTCKNPGVFNRDYIDVISADWYDAYFSTIQPFYDVLAAHPAKPEQQLALVPGVFSAPNDQLRYLQDYFAYADTKNQTCNLPRGTLGFTGIYDGCLVWIVLGWEAGNLQLGNTLYRGLLDPASEQIALAWEAEVARLPPQRRERAKLLQPILQMLLRQ